MTSGIIFFVSTLALFLLAGSAMYFAGIYNSLVQVKNNIGKAWSNIDVLLLQRNEQLPKLIDLCGAYMTHEKNLLHQLTTLRAGYDGAKKTPHRIAIENKMEEVLQKLIFTAEQYPDLKANSLFQSTLQQISELEESIAGRRVFLNDSVAVYNTQIEKFPHLMFAAILNYKPHPYLQTPEKK